MQNNKYDIIIIGAGIVGCLIARFLSKYKKKILLIEKQIDIGMNTSSANSAIIHSGYDPKPDTKKALLNVKGNKIWHEIAPELGIPFKKTGSFVVAIGTDEFKKLFELFDRGIANGVPGLKILNRDELFKKEPLINPDATGALFAPTAAVIDPFTATLAAAENAKTNGVEFLFETSFLDFIYENKKIIGIITNKGNFYSNWVINSAGLYSDEIAHKANTLLDVSIIPRKGEYIIFDSSKFFINNVLFPIPSENSKGCLISTTTHGNVMIGPNARLAKNKEDTETTKEGMEEIIKNAKKLIPSIDEKNSIATFAGVRSTPSTSEKDFIIEIPKNVYGLINLCGIESPGFASAPAIALYVIELLKDVGEKLEEKREFNPIRKPFVHFHLLSYKEREELIKKNPAYGRIVCRCEEVTEGEIIDAIHSPIPATTYDGIKRRTWLGTGRCQGAFDYPRVIKILARELNLPEEKITKKGIGSEIIFRKTKDY